MNNRDATRRQRRRDRASPRGSCGIVPAMRVIAGLYRGRRLTAPAGAQTRPILDRVKVALFDWLGSRLARPGALPPVNVLDLFCGGGSLGIEALSRGATFCAFVEEDAGAFRCLLQNLDRLGVGSAARACNCPVQSAQVQPPTGAFGIIFLDPPYALSEDVTENSLLGGVFGRLGHPLPVEDDAIVLWRHAVPAAMPAESPNHWRPIECRTWGKMAVTLLQRPPRYVS